MAWTCEISGESLGATQDEIVVTPSGHLCIKRLLLTKLAENGGMDPFETIRELPLSEDQLVTLAASSTSSSVPSPGAPPRPQLATSLPNLLQLVQKEYDSLVLELFDTRRALEETRRELSQALYQNDAAVRVVARLAQERDAAQQELERWSASVGANGGGGGGPGALNGTAAAALTTTTNVDATPATAAPTDGSASLEPETKRRRLDPSEGPLKTDLPEDDWQTLQDTWERSSAGRKARLKAAAARASTPESLAKYTILEQKAWHKSTNKGILCMAKTALDDNEHGLIVTAGKDKQLVVYDEASQVVKHTFPFGSPATSVDISVALVVAGDAKGKLAAFSLEGEESDFSLGELNLGAAIVDVTVHPSRQHVLAATANGRVNVIVCSAATKTLHHVAFFQRDGDVEDVFTCACLHPDGLIYAVGTKMGQLQVWDLKNKVLAATLEVRLVAV
jgi:pre-mRNA-processing factor 19